MIVALIVPSFPQFFSSRSAVGRSSEGCSWSKSWSCSLLAESAQWRSGAIPKINITSYLQVSWQVRERSGPLTRNLFVGLSSYFLCPWAPRWICRCDLQRSVTCHISPGGDVCISVCRPYFLWTPHPTGRTCGTSLGSSGAWLAPRPMGGGPGVVEAVTAVTHLLSLKAAGHTGREKPKKRKQKQLFGFTAWNLEGKNRFSNSKNSHILLLIYILIWLWIVNISEYDWICNMFVLFWITLLYGIFRSSFQFFHIITFIFKIEDTCLVWKLKPWSVLMFPRAPRWPRFFWGSYAVLGRATTPHPGHGGGSGPFQKLRVDGPHAKGKICKGWISKQKEEDKPPQNCQIQFIWLV